MAKGDHRRTDQYLLRMSEEEKLRIKSKADAANVTMSEAFRVGGEQYLDNLLAAKQAPTTNVYSTSARHLAGLGKGKVGNPGDDALLTEFRAVAAEIERRITGE